MSDLKEGEPHPSASNAADYILSLGREKLTIYLESFSSCAIENNRVGEICGETLRRILHDEGVSDRYLLGLAWCLMELEEIKNP